MEKSVKMYDFGFKIFYFICLCSVSRQSLDKRGRGVFNTAVGQQNQCNVGHVIKGCNQKIEYRNVILHKKEVGTLHRKYVHPKIFN